MKRTFDYKGYPCEPHGVTPDVWYYVEPDGLNICHRVNGNPSEIIILPWRMIKRAVADHEKAKQRKKHTRESGR